MMRFKNLILGITLVATIGAFRFTNLSAESSVKEVSENTKKPQELKSDDEGFVIVHLGDSHIQAGHMSGIIRTALQKEFGSLGRGWVSPYRVYGSNQPCDYNLKVTGRWSSYKLTNQREGVQDVGPGGMIVRPRMTRYTMSIFAKNGESFDNILVYRTNAAPHLIPEGMSSSSYELRPSVSDEKIVVDTLAFSSLQSSVMLKPDSSVTPSSNVGFGGFVLQNTKNDKGILYNEIGLNGAFMSQYLNKQFVHSLGLLHPQMIIVSLGSNESSGRSINRSSYYNTIDSFYKMLRDEMPEAEILFTTPPPYFKSRSVKVGTKKVRRGKRGKRRVRRVPVYRRSTSPNDNVFDAAEVIASYCKDHNLTCINLYELMGGEDGGNEWLNEGLYARDRIHFSVDGYRKQGNLILSELKHPVTKAYKAYTDPNSILQANNSITSKGKDQ